MIAVDTIGLEISDVLQLSNSMQRFVTELLSRNFTDSHVLRIGVAFLDGLSSIPTVHLPLSSTSALAQSVFSGVAKSRASKLSLSQLSTLLTDSRSGWRDGAFKLALVISDNSFDASEIGALRTAQLSSAVVPVFLLSGANIPSYSAIASLVNQLPLAMLKTVAQSRQADRLERWHVSAASVSLEAAKKIVVVLTTTGSSELSLVKSIDGPLNLLHSSATFVLSHRLHSTEFSRFYIDMAYSFEVLLSVPPLLCLPQTFL